MSSVRLAGTHIVASRARTLAEGVGEEHWQRDDFHHFATKWWPSVPIQNLSLSHRRKRPISTLIAGRLRPLDREQVNANSTQKGEHSARKDHLIVMIIESALRHRAVLAELRQRD